MLAGLLAGRMYNSVAAVEQQQQQQQEKGVWHTPPPPSLDLFYLHFLYLDDAMTVIIYIYIQQRQIRILRINQMVR